jgi:type IV secretory pathway VirJ component
VVRKKLLILLIFACASATGLLAAIGYFQTDSFISIDAAALPKQGHSGLAVVYLSGDMGFRLGTDDTMLNRLAADGLPVIGVNSVTFFKQKRSEVEVAQLLIDAARRALALKHVSRLIFIGHSFGADMVQAGLRRLPQDIRSKTRLIALVVPGRGLYYQVSAAERFNWTTADADGLATARLLTWAPTVCIFGQREKDSLCPLLLQPNVRKIALPGGHLLQHDGNAIYAALISALDHPTFSAAAAK